ncbi:MAG TPA: hypothetical protein VJ867_07040 [Gemmatimonadaceae bacterium]|nr:hypothetical protein [Gemmatimonadaceae bacterium]
MPIRVTHMTATPQDASRALDEQLSALDRDAAELRAALRELEEDCASLETLAMDAVSRGEDGAARDYLHEFELRRDEVARITADIRVVEATAASYREAAAALNARQVDMHPPE